MEEGIPSLSSGSVGSRFVSQKEIDQANANRDAEWKAAYERIGQEPPPRPVEDNDGRSLFERLQQQKNIKQEEWDEKMKLGNQFRGIDEEDSAFLAQVQNENIAKEREQKKRDAEELAAFKAGIAKRAEQASPVASSSTAPAPAPAPAASKTTTTTALKKSLIGKKDQKTLLKGVIVKKKGKEKSKPKDKSDFDSTSKPSAEQKATSDRTDLDAAAGATKTKRSAPSGEPEDEDASDTKRSRIE